MGFVLILGVAFLKAFLVGFYFMHLKWDWRLFYFIIVPVFILGVMMVIILMPDCVIGPGRDAAEILDIAKGQLNGPEVHRLAATRKRSSGDASAPRRGSREPCNGPRQGTPT